MTGKRTHNLITSKYKGKLKFNGFFFAVNLKKIRSSAFNATHLFAPHNIMVEQEDTLMSSMEKKKLLPKICKYLFVYHYKSVTVKAAGSTGRSRNNLHFFHPEILKNSEPVSMLLKNNSQDKEGFLMATDWEVNMYKYMSEPIDMDRAYPSQKDINIKVIAFILPQLVPKSSFMKLKNADESGNYDMLRICHNHDDGVDDNSRIFGIKNRRIATSKHQRFRKGILSCCSTKVFQEISAVLQISSSLKDLYEVRIEYFFNDALDYERDDFTDVDLVVNMATTSRDIERLHNVKTSGIKVAWITEMFGAWHNIQSIGNYDLVLVPSEHAKLYIQSWVSLPSICLIKCPRLLSWAQRQSKALVEIFPPAISMNISSQSLEPTGELDFLIDVHDFLMDAVSAELAKSFKANSTWGVLRRGCSRNVVWIYSNNQDEPGEKIVIPGLLTQLISSTRIVIVKIASSTLFNGMDPFVLDVLANGAKVLLYQHVPQSYHGSLSRLPTFQSSSALMKKLELLIAARSSTFIGYNKPDKPDYFQMLRQEILEENSNFARASYLATTLNSLGMLNINAQPAARIPSDFADRDSLTKLCVGISSFPYRFGSQTVDAVRNKILDMIRLFAESSRKTGVRLHIYLLQPLHSTKSDLTAFKGIIDECEQFVLKLDCSRIVSTTLYWNKIYISDERKKKRKEKVAQDSIVNDIDCFLTFLGKNANCDWCMLSNMEWTLNSLWMDKVLPFLTSRSTNLVAWDYAKSRRAKGKVQTSVVEVEAEGGGLTPWNILFRWKDFSELQPRIMHLKDAETKASHGRSVINEVAFANTIFAGVPTDKVSIIQSKIPFQVMNYYPSKTILSSLGFKNFLSLK